MNELERQPPANVEAEQSCLGACLISAAAIDEVAAVLTRGDEWYHLPHRHIWQALTWLHGEGVSVDQITVGDELRHLGKLEEAGGLVYLAQLTAGVATARNAGYHAKIIRSLWTARELISRAQTAAAAAYLGEQDIAALLASTQAAIGELVADSGNGHIRPYAEIQVAAMTRIAALAAVGGPLSGLPTGFPALDRRTGGWHGGELVILAARPSVGKSALAMNFADTVAQTGVEVDFFSLEMSDEQLACRHLAANADIPAEAIRHGRLTPEEVASVRAASARLAKLPIWIDHRGSLSLADIAASCRRRARGGKLGLIVVDYLQLVRPAGRADSREQEVSQVSRAAKGLAKELDVPVILLSQLNRAVESRPDRRPQLSDLRESGAIEQDADMVLFIHRPELAGKATFDYHLPPSERQSGQSDVVQLPSAGMAELVIGKHRNGAGGSVLMRWEEDVVSFSPFELETRRAAPAWVDYDNG